MSSFRLNGKEVKLDAPADMPLLWVLRDEIGLTGTKYGCGVALCGACTVHMDGQAIRSCVTRLAAVEGKSITTIEAIEYRRSMLDGSARHRGVLELAVARAGWGSALKSGPHGERRGRGVAVHQSFNTYVCEVAEVSVSTDGKVRVDRVVCAVDCGLAINPDVIRAQMEGGIGYGLAAALHGEITLKEGQVEQSNFNAYIPLRIDEMPAIEVHIVPSTEKPTGVGEPGTAVIAAAVGNAIFAATGKRIRKLPLGDQLRT
jgi:isoquinoline 1-oxidoreductase beta subunit